jgi:hypothetical protein
MQGDVDTIKRFRRFIDQFLQLGIERLLLSDKTMELTKNGRRRFNKYFSTITVNDYLLPFDTVDGQTIQTHYRGYAQGMREDGDMR